MYSTLLSTSAHALAVQYLRRMETFPIPPTNIPAPTLIEAQNRLRDAEVELGERLRELHKTFDELMRRDLGSQRYSASRNDERDRAREGNRTLSKAEVNDIRDRMSSLERRLNETPIPSSRKGKEKATGEEEGIDGKRSRARLLLEDMSSRLQIVEGLKDDLDMRYTDLEDLVNSKIQDEMEIVRLGNGRWRIMENLRDPDGVIRGLKRKHDDVSRTSHFSSGKEVEPIIISTLDAKGSEPTLTESQAQDVAIQADRSEITRLRAEVNSLKTIVNSNLNVNNASSTLSALLRQVETLQTELRNVKEEQRGQVPKNAHQEVAKGVGTIDKLVDPATLENLKQHCSELVKTVSSPVHSSEVILIGSKY
jgi:hypothetical protein